LSGKRPSRQRKAKDRIDLERHYGIKNNVRDIGFYLLIYKKKLIALISHLVTDRGRRFLQSGTRLTPGSANSKN
ncbi:lipopolysaccharide core heptose(II) kinase RfaY, partial [Salmonella enterica subsp. enterica serovar Anatum]|nr:lipopolysaccharide core heptose(II) kinase RfaY [Salmonella enterica subsp. enterica serovar Anatum]